MYDIEVMQFSERSVPYFVSPKMITILKKIRFSSNARLQFLLEFLCVFHYLQHNDIHNKEAKIFRYVQK